MAVSGFYMKYPAHLSILWGDVSRRCDVENFIYKTYGNFEHTSEKEPGRVECLCDREFYISFPLVIIERSTLKV